MNKKLRNTLAGLFVLLFLLNGGLLVWRWVSEQNAQQAQEQVDQTQEEAEQAADSSLPEPEPEPEIPVAPLDPRAEYLYQIDLEELRQTNPDVRGWIAIPGTQLDYPYLKGETNDYYLNRTWKGSRSAAGSVFMEVQCPEDFSFFNTILYGHNMKNGTMFGSLKKYRQQSYYEENPCIYVVDARGLCRYEIFAAFEAEVVRDTFRLDLDNDRKRDAFLNYSAAMNGLESTIKPTPKDSLITLSTCTGKDYDHRWVVQGVLTGVFEIPEQQPEQMQEIAPQT